MEFSGEMNIYRESELSGDFEGEISKKRIRRALAIQNQSPPAGNSTYSPRTGFLVWRLLGILGLEEKMPSLTPHPRV
ncbi:hypothetical protein CK203_059651 [Vitis vinifera]|uniref:Uncharacterized protein n=1 Tax=Vitis vinifera TaxID=29760 RepID=A0A438H0I2_VITVI|nr:hypothetical protein CK203_059651 [Vitis vinifera]